VDQLSIGEFSRQSRLSPKALRLYDELGLLPPSFVDPDNGYRFYEVDQLERARRISLLRQIDVPLAQIRVMVEAEPKDAAEMLSEFWASAGKLHRERQALVDFLVKQLQGDRTAMYEVTTRQIPKRTLLCLKRHTNDRSVVWDMGKEFIGYFKEQPLPLLEGKEGATFLIYHGEVNADSDGPVEMCRPIPAEEASDIARRYPKLTLRTEPAHEEAAVHMGKDELPESQWQLAGESMLTWAREHGREPSALGIRITFFVEPPLTSESVPDPDFSVPLATTK
jgi:DNA-binding transcriptional MerR regulator